MVADDFQFWGPIKPSVRGLWKRFFAHDSPLAFQSILRAYVEPGSELLEVGAGPGYLYPYRLRGNVRRIVGIDPDPCVLENREIDEGVVGVCEHLPFPNDSFDIVFHRMVAEHLSEPVAATAEIARVLRRGGLLIMQTPNAWHYSMLASRCTPLWFHRKYMHFLATRKQSEDVHPTHYRMNTAAAIRRTVTCAGLEVEGVEFLTAPPGYLRFSVVAFCAGALYAKSVESLVPCLRPSIVAVARKPARRTHVLSARP